MKAGIALAGILLLIFSFSVGFAQSENLTYEPLLSQGGYVPSASISPPPPPPPAMGYRVPGSSIILPPPPPQYAQPGFSSPAPVPPAPVPPVGKAPVPPPAFVQPTPPPQPSSTAAMPAMPAMPGADLQNFPPAPILPGPAASGMSPGATSGMTSAPIAFLPPKQMLSAGMNIELQRLMRGLSSLRGLPENPRDVPALQRLQDSGRWLARMLGLAKYPVLPLFRSSTGDVVIRDRSLGAVEYRYFGDFHSRVHGWIRPASVAQYADLLFEGRGRHKTRIRASLTATGPLRGYFYLDAWDKFGRLWHMQGICEEILLHDSGTPAGGRLIVSGLDPAGRNMGLELNFPLEVVGPKPPPPGRPKRQPVSSRNYKYY